MGNRKVICAVSKMNGFVIGRYSTAAEAAKCIGVSADVVRCGVSRGAMAMNLDCFFRYEEDFNGTVDYSEHPRSAPVIAVDLYTLRVMWFSGAAECARALDASYSNVRLAVAKRGTIKRGRWRLFHQANERQFHEIEEWARSRRKSMRVA